MTINYEELLTVEQKRQILDQRVKQFASEAWQHELNKETCQAVGDIDGVAAADNALVILEAAIDIHQTKLTELNEV